MALSGLCSYFVMYTPWTSTDWLRFVTSFLIGFIVYLMFITVFRLISLKDISRLMNMGKKIIR